MNKQTTEMGMNRTGISTAPVMSTSMKEEAERAPVQPETHDVSLAGMQAFKAEYIQEADPIGTIPVPTTLKGAVKAGAQAIMGTDPRILIDKLSERAAFERSGVRLYDALITKCMTAAPDVDLTMIRSIRGDEARHFHLVQEALKKIGADPTAQTPSADVAGVESMGLVQVINDPRTTISQCVHAILTAELVDNDAWELLVELAKQSGHQELADSFQDALEQELVHLDHVRRWHQELILKQDVSRIQ